MILSKDRRSESENVPKSVERGTLRSPDPGLIEIDIYFHLGMTFGYFFLLTIKELVFHFLRYFFLLLNNKNISFIFKEFFTSWRRSRKISD